LKGSKRAHEEKGKHLGGWSRPLGEGTWSGNLEGDPTSGTTRKDGSTKKNEQPNSRAIRRERIVDPDFGGRRPPRSAIKKSGPSRGEGGA